MLSSAGVCKASGPEFRYESNTSSGATTTLSLAMAKDSVVVAVVVVAAVSVSPGSEAAVTPPALTPFFHY